MDIKEVLSRVDHTLLSQTATLDDIKSLCDDARRFKTASVCIAPSFVKEAKAYVGESVKICTVIGFPNGYSTQAVKSFEARDAIENGADEIDMVINIGLVKDKRFDDILSEIKAVKEACGDKVLKVIIETCLLSEDEKIKMCKIVSDSGADFIKTSTGFSIAGATFEDVALLKKHCSPHLKIKAAGGISSIADAEKFIEFSAERLGTSRIVKILKQKENENAKALSDTAY